MDSLLTYVNERFQVVRNLSFDERSIMADAEISLVARELWDNVSIIDDFAAQNPYHLSKKHLDTALSWKNALPGYFKVVRYQNGCAIMMNEAGVFCVSGVTTEITDEIGPAPAYVEAVLIPFDDSIVYDGFLMAFDVPEGSSEGRAIQDEFEERVRGGIAMHAADFAERVQAWRASQEADELDRLLEDIAREAEVSRNGEALPEGFHRGVLADMAGAERASAIDAHAKQLAATPAARDRLRKWFDDEMALRAHPAHDLQACLFALKKHDLQEAAVELQVNIPASSTKAVYAKALAEAVPGDFELMENTLIEASDPAFASVRRALAEGDIAFTADDLVMPVAISPLEPYSFVFRSGVEYTLVVPDEVRAMLAAADFDDIARKREQRREALAYVDAAVVYYGIATLDDVYAQYRTHSVDPMDQHDFELLVYREASFNDQGFCLWTNESVTYAIHFTLSRDYVATQLLQQRRGRIMEFARSAETGEVQASMIEGFVANERQMMQGAFDSLELLLNNLISMHREIEAKPLELALGAQSVMDAIYAEPSVVALTRFFDERVPDGEDDYLFADRVVEEIVSSAIEVGEIHDVYNFVKEAGLEFCCADADRLPMLVSNVFSSVPSWDSNGWSPKEIYEQMTGRKVFYNEKGEPMKVGRDDACPCGSGLKYRDCCGR